MTLGTPGETRESVHRLQSRRVHHDQRRLNAIEVPVTV